MIRMHWDWPAECAGVWVHACKWTSEEHYSVWHSQTSVPDLSQHAQHSHIRCSSSCSCRELRALTFGKEGTEILYCTVSVCGAIGVENKKNKTKNKKRDNGGDKIKQVNDENKQIRRNDAEAEWLSIKVVYCQLWLIFVLNGCMKSTNCCHLPFPQKKKKPIATDLLKLNVRHVWLQSASFWDTPTKQVSSDLHITKTISISNLTFLW